MRVRADALTGEPECSCMSDVAAPAPESLPGTHDGASDILPVFSMRRRLDVLEWAGMAQS